MTDLEFVDELPGEAMGQNARSLVTKERVLAMKDHEGKWMQWPSKTSATGVRKLLELHPGIWEVVNRKVGTDTSVFCRYCGEQPGPKIVAKTQCVVCTEALDCFSDDQAGRDEAVSEHFKQNPECRQAASDNQRRSGGRA